MIMNESQRAKGIYRVTIVGLVLNVVLSAFKMFAGIVGHSAAMVADAVHSLSDLATDVVVLVFVRISTKPKDRDHNWGHGKYETLASLIIGVALAAVGIEILVEGVGKIVAVLQGDVLPRPGVIALVAALLSIVVKEGLYQYSVRAGRKLESPSLIANSWHHRSDALSSIGVLIGVGAAYFLGEKWCIADPIAAIVVALFIVKVAYSLTRVAVEEMLEKSLPESVETEIMQIIGSVDGVSDPHNLRTRRIGPTIAIEVHVRVDGSMDVRGSHDLTKEIERALRGRFGDNTAVVIHVEPIKA